MSKDAAGKAEGHGAVIGKGCWVSEKTRRMRHGCTLWLIFWSIRQRNHSNRSVGRGHNNPRPFSFGCRAKPRSARSQHIPLATSRSLFTHRLALSQRQGRTHQRKVAECLWEVAKLAPLFRMVFFGKQSQIVAG